MLLARNVFWASISDFIADVYMKITARNRIAFANYVSTDGTIVIRYQLVQITKVYL